jgi:hypothetical protein
MQAGFVLLFQLFGFSYVEFRHARIPSARRQWKKSMQARGASGVG